MNEEKMSRGRTNLILAACSLTMFAVGFSMFKLLPMQAPIQEYFHINVGAYGWLNTAQNWFVIIFTVPMGFLVRKMPCKWSMALSFALLFAGSMVQLVTSDYYVFVIGRMLEGGGYGFISLVGNSLTANLVKPGKVGFWISLQVMIAMVGQIIHTRAAAWMLYVQGMSFRTVFWAISLLQLGTFVFWMAGVPASVRVTGNAAATKPDREQTLRVFRSKSNWLVSIALAIFTMAFVSFSAFVIQYLVIRGMEANAAAKTYSYTSVFGICAILGFGWLSDRLGTKRKLAIMSFFAGVVSMLLLMYLPLQLIMIYVVVMGTLPRSIAGLSNASSVDLAEIPADIPIVNSFRNTVSQLIGGVLGGILIGYLIQYAGYPVTIYFLSISMAAGGICWIFAKKVP